MKLHDNSVFLGRIIVLLTMTKRLKTERFVEISGGAIGFSHLQIHGSPESFANTVAQSAGDPLAAKIGRHSEAQNLALPLVQSAPQDKSRHPASKDGDQIIVLQAGGGVPMRRLRAGRLNPGNLGHITWFAAPDYWHIVIMHALALLLFFLAQPFWETKPPERWTDGEIDTIRRFSPWAQAVAPDPAVIAYLATAAPIEMAEAELRLRLRKNASRMSEPDPDYTDYLRENRANQFVQAITYPTLKHWGNAVERQRMEEETVMVISRKVFHIVGHFPPTPADPV